MHINRIYLDMDGVLADFAGGAARAHRMSIGDAVARWNSGEYDGLYAALGVSEEKCWDTINNKPTFWSSLDAYAWTDKLWDECAKVAPCTVLSSPSKDPNCVAGKLEWLQRWKGRQFRDYAFVPAKLKHIIAKPGDVLIDDRDDNCQRWREAGGMAILFPQHWNSNHACLNPLAFALDALSKIVNGEPARKTGHKDVSLRYGLLPRYALAEVAAVYSMGARKYADHNWRQGLPWSKAIDAKMRHNERFIAGEDRDQIDGQHHLASCAFWDLALMTFAREHPELDDRYKSDGESAAIAEIIERFRVIDRPE